MDVEHVVTEHGMVNLRGLSTQERALALISLADDAHKDALAEAAAHRRHLREPREDLVLRQGAEQVEVGEHHASPPLPHCG